ncbi:MAG: 50S ribosomal protein L24 [Candidatus Nanoarchaeia archaeon]|jgi:large subunit ribosomal protein L24|nr:50S ribosomal protein L24 [Candidatus Nanoarchaeia archaeon]|tara:strand:- start:14979 stop:15368 length:390 start_codon:yes stop_codon:yes gene_type:complete
MKSWIKSWKSSVQPKKQRKYRQNAPLHIKHRLLSVNLSKDLKKRYNMRNVEVRKGDTVKVLRGQYKNKSGIISNVDLKKLKVNVDGIENVRKDGTKNFYPFDPSNLQITELFLDDKKRKLKVGEKNVTS